MWQILPKYFKVSKNTFNQHCRSCRPYTVELWFSNLVELTSNNGASYVCLEWSDFPWGWWCSYEQSRYKVFCQTIAIDPEQACTHCTHCTVQCNCHIEVWQEILVSWKFHETVNMKFLSFGSAFLLVECGCILFYRWRLYSCSFRLRTTQCGQKVLFGPK